MHPLAVGCDRLIEPLATIHAMPRRRPCGLSYFQEQRICEARNHQSSTASADVHLHPTGSSGHVGMFHAGLVSFSTANIYLENLQPRSVGVTRNLLHEFPQ